MQRAFDLARAAASAGDDPFGSVLVLDGEIVAEMRNTVRTDDDLTAHPELKLARWAGRELSPEERARATMYTSTEPCPMCSGAIRYAGLDRVVYSTSGPALADVRGGSAGHRASELVGDGTTVEGPLLEREGLAIHEEFWLEDDPD